MFNWNVRTRGMHTFGTVVSLLVKRIDMITFYLSNKTLNNKSTYITVICNANLPHKEFHYFVSQGKSSLNHIMRNGMSKKGSLLIQMVLMEEFSLFSSSYHIKHLQTAINS